MTAIETTRRLWPRCSNRSGSHRVLHPIRRNETEVDQQRDLGLSKDTLERRLGVHVGLVAYPNGTPDDFDAVTERAAEASGYSAGVTTIAGWNSPSTPRFRL